MCVAVSGKVLSIDGTKAVVDVEGNHMPVQIGVVSPKVGDYVLIHAGYAVDIVSMETSDEIDELFREVEDAFNELHP